MRTRVVLLVLGLLLLPVPAAAQAQESGCVAGVDTHAPVVPPQPVDATDYRDLATGAGVAVAVIDTGVAAHPELGEVEPVADLVNSAAPDPLLDCDGHGTVVAGVIAGSTLGVAPDARILSVRQTSAIAPRDVAHADDAEATAGTLASLADAIHLSLDGGAQIINVSVVACVPGDIAVQLDSGVLDDALHRAEEEQVVVVAAAGNLSTACEPDSVVYPTHAQTVLGVGARATSHDMADYSLPAPADKVALSAPAHVRFGLSPTSPGWASAVLPPDGEAREFHGTSFAAPIVAGTAALLRQRYPEYSAAELRSHLVEASQPAGGAIDPEAVVSFVPAESAPEVRSVVVASPVAPDRAMEGRALVWLSVVAVLAAAGVAVAGLRRSGRSGP